MNNHTLWEKVCSYQNLIFARNRVKENAGGPGVDHVTVEEFDQNQDENVNILHNQLEKGD
jgi:retron-type reverse transcriptase